MKKIVLFSFIAILSLVSANVFASSVLGIDDNLLGTEVTEVSLHQVKSPTKKSNILTIDLKNTSDAELRRRVDFYENNKQGLTSALLLSIFVGFGTGVREVGNIVSASLWEIVDSCVVGVTAGLFCVGAIVPLVGWTLSHNLTGQDLREYYAGSAFWKAGWIIGVIGLGVHLITNLIQIAPVVSRVKEINANFRKDLGITEDLKFDISITPSANKKDDYNFMLSASLEF